MNRHHIRPLPDRVAAPSASSYPPRQQLSTTPRAPDIPLRRSRW
jgi:hypothetical protein